MLAASPAHLVGGFSVYLDRTVEMLFCKAANCLTFLLCSDPLLNVCILMLQILPGHGQLCTKQSLPCRPFLNFPALIFVQNILVPNLKPFPIGNHTLHIWVSSCAALPRAKLVDRGFGELLMHRFVIIIVLLKLQLEAARQQQR